MRTLKDIEAKHRSSPVVTDEPAFAGSGTLILDGARSSVVLQSKQSLSGRGDDDGWFELRLRAASGRLVLLHNALLTGSTQHHFSDVRTYEEHIYPNTVVLGAEALVAGNKVPAISFTAGHLGLFFQYQHVEWQSLYEAPRAVLKALRTLRTDNRREYDVFKPRDLYLIHQFPRVFSFRTPGRRYDVFVGSRMKGPGWSRIEYQTEPIATISFDEPVGIEEAIEAVWQWKRFFGLVLLRPLSLTSLTARSGAGRRTREADFYLPNHASDEDDARDRSDSPWAGDVPLNRWGERKLLGEVIRTWLSKEDERQRFRVSLEAVAGRMRRRVSLDDIVTLCSGIESLSELAGPEALTREEVRLISDGAVAAAKAHGVEIGEDRLRGVIGYLQHPSLPQRLKLMFERLEPTVPKADGQTLRSAVLQLRTVAAHGLAPTGDVMPKAAPAIAGLASACALYDLLTCGLPSRTASDRGLPLTRRAREAAAALTHIKRNRPATAG